MSELSHKLRVKAGWLSSHNLNNTSRFLSDAADEIEQLEASVVTLKFSADKAWVMANKVNNINAQLGIENGKLRAENSKLKGYS